MSLVKTSRSLRTGKGIYAVRCVVQKAGENFSTILADIVDRVTKTDVLVVGSEAAGAMAAVKASDHDVNVTLVTKGQDIGQRGSTSCAAAAFSACVIDSRSIRDVLGLPGDERDSPEQFMEDIIRTGQFMNDQSLVEVVVKEAPFAMRDLMNWGFKCDETATERLGAWSAGHKYPRNVYGVVKWGPQYIAVMKKVIKERPNIDLVTDTMVVDLLRHNGKVVGATALDLFTGEFLAFQSKSVVLATGGTHNVYSRITSEPFLTGDGQAMAYRAGVGLLDMEFQRFHLVVVWPPGLYGTAITLPDSLRRFYHWYNRLGQRFIKAWSPDTMEQVSLDIGCAAINAEILAGRGSKHGGVYCSIHHVPQEMIDYQGEWGPHRDWKDPTTQKDFKPYVERMKRGEALEIAVGCHNTLGGIKIDKNCETSLRGLFAAGECAGGVDGALRLGGMALTKSIAQGAVSGNRAAENASKQPLEEPDLKDVIDTKKRIFGPLEREEGVKCLDLKKRLQEQADRRISTPRDGPGLAEAITAIEQLKEKELPNLFVQTKETRYNLEWIEGIQLFNLFTNLEAIARAAHLRTESRGAHIRLDCPETDYDKWFVNIVIIKANGKMQLTTQPVVVTTVKPPAGVKRVIPPAVQKEVVAKRIQLSKPSPVR